MWYDQKFIFLHEWIQSACSRPSYEIGHERNNILGSSCSLFSISELYCILKNWINRHFSKVFTCFVDWKSRFQYIFIFFYSYVNKNIFQIVTKQARKSFSTSSVTTVGVNTQIKSL